MVSVLMDFFEGDELEKFFSGNLSVKEKEDFLNKVKALSNNEVTNFVEEFLKSDADKISKQNEDDKKSTSEMLSEREKKEKINHWIASSIAIIGLIALLIILTIRIKSIYYINNSLTGVAFLSVIINLLLKEYYKTSSLKKITEEKNKLLKDIEKHKGSDFLDKSNPNSSLYN
ncbi:hypothetical protein SDC9_160831 [bioreactor metagenome]|uniref:Uncharacterized protein n=1 Tax=bioreactor metagenome TaxID=1076179 RepID=A0A645FHS3_9ZZZZ